MPQHGFETCANQPRFTRARSAALRAVVFLAILPPALGQDANMIARASSVDGPARLVSRGWAPVTLTQGSFLNPGDRIDTHGGGRVVIELSDGSMVIVQPESVIVLKDFRAAESLREFFNITVGRVRVKINHVGGRVNPYRMNTPTASIAVRGTEFSVRVDIFGDTQVEVYEGAVEVTSLADPNQSVLLEAGRGMAAIPGQDFRLFNGNGTDRDDGEHDRDQAGDSRTRAALASGGASGSADLEQVAPLSADSAYQRYISSLSDIAQVPFLLRFNAFPDLQLDSLENPAIAAAFQATEGRLVMLSSLNGTGSLQGAAAVAPEGAQPFNYGVTPQFSLFVPVPNSRWVLGGSFSASRIGSSSLGSAPDSGPPASRQSLSQSLFQNNGSSINGYFSGSLLAARRLGASTSLGFEIDSLKGFGSLHQTTVDPDPGVTTVDTSAANTNIAQTRFTVGLEHDLSRRQTLSGFFRYGLIGAADEDRSHLIDGSPAQLDSTRSGGHSDEFGLRLRGETSGKWFYGATASWLGIALNDALVRAAAVDSHQHDRAQRVSAGLGLGYALTRRTVLSFDVAAGSSWAGTTRFADATVNLLQTGNQDGRFLSSHAAIQSDLTRRLFVSASWLWIFQENRAGMAVFPDQFGNSVAVADAFVPLTAGLNQPANHYSDFGAGWRFSPRLFAEYVFTTDYGVSSPSHSLMLRYTFHARE